MVLHFGYSAKIVTIETAVLYRDLEHKIYMKGPQGMPNVQKDDFIILNGCIYGFIQALRQYFKKAIKILMNLELMGGNVDPYLYMKKSAKGIGHVALYVDDNLMIGGMAAIDNAITVLKSKG